MTGPDFWIIAGPNGAGKTTLVSRGMFSVSVPSDSLINPDDITLEYLRAGGIATWADAPLETQKRLFIKAADEAQRRLEEKIENGDVAVVESVLSTQKYRPLVERTRELGGRFFLIYVILSSPDLSRSRVSSRAAHGGHDVPSEKLARRWRNSLSIAPWFAAQAERFWFVDNSNSEKEVNPLLVLSGEDGEVHLHARDDDTLVDAIGFRLLRGILQERKRLVLRDF